jgi:hypothetical protein
VEVSYLPPALPSVRPPARLSARRSVSQSRPAVCPSVRPPASQSVGPLVRPVHQSALPACRPSAQAVGPLVSPIHQSARPAVCPSARPPVRQSVGPLVWKVTDLHRKKLWSVLLLVPPVACRYPIHSAGVFKSAADNRPNPIGQRDCLAVERMS